MSILQLPIELMSPICEALVVRDLISLRSCCRLLAVETMPIFAKRCFAQLSLPATSQSLSYLRAIADHNNLKDAVCHVQILPLMFGNRFSMDIYEFRTWQFESETGQLPWSFEDPIDKLADDDALLCSQHASYLTTVRDVFENSTSGQLESTLEYCFKRFQNLKRTGLDLCCYDDPEMDQEIEHPHYLGEGDLMRRLGGRPISKWINQTPHDEIGREIASHCFEAVLKAMIGAQNETSKLEGLSTCWNQSREDHFCGKGYAMATYSESDLASRESILDHVALLKIRNMHLCFPNLQDISYDERYLFQQTLVKTMARSLRHFSSSLGWSEQSAWFSKNLELPHLTTLELQTFSGTVETMQEILQATAPTLKELRIHSILFQEENHSNSWIESDESLSPRLRIWSRLRDWLASHLDLRYMSLSNVRDFGRCLIEFKDSSQLEKASTYFTAICFDANLTNWAYTQWLSQIEALYHQEDVLDSEDEEWSPSLFD